MRLFAYLFIAHLLIPVVALAQHSIALGYNPALERLRLCSGVDFNDVHLFKKAAFPYSYDSSVRFVPDISISSFIVKSSEEIKRLTNFDARIEVSLPFAGVEGTLSTRVSERDKSEGLKLVFIAKSIYNPEIIDQDRIHLTTQAAALVGNPSRFTNEYGSYYCSGITRGHLIAIEVDLSKELSTSLNSLMQTGELSIGLASMGADIKEKLAKELKQVAEQSETRLRINTRGGPELNNYRTAVKTIFSGNNSMESIGTFLENVLDSFGYSNAKMMGCTLSDYSTWGIQNHALMNSDIISSQRSLSELYTNISNSIADVRLLMRDDFSRYYPHLSENSCIDLIRELTTLRREVDTAHRKLNNNDGNYIGAEYNLIKKHGVLKKKITEPFDFIVGKARSVSGPATNPPTENNPFAYPQSFVYVPAAIANNLSFLTGFCVNSYILNTLASRTAFNYIDRLYIECGLNDSLIETITPATFVHTASSADANLDIPEKLSLYELIGTSRLPIVLNQVNAHIVSTTGRFFQNATNDKLDYDYYLKIRDRSGRVYRYLFINLTLNQSNSGPMVLVTNKLPGNPCTCLKSYTQETDPANNLAAISGVIPADVRSLAINYSLAGVNFSDSLIVEITTDNAAINSTISDHAALSRQDFVPSNLRPIIFVPLYPQVNKFFVKWYSQKFDGTRDSPIYSMEIPCGKKLCNNHVYLKPN